MKKKLTIIGLLVIMIIGLSELNQAKSKEGQLSVMTEKSCARATEPCPEKPDVLMVVCEEGGAGYTCTYACPYVLDATN